MSTGFEILLGGLLTGTIALALALATFAPSRDPWFLGAACFLGVASVMVLLSVVAFPVKRNV